MGEGERGGEEERKIKREFIEEGEGSNITSSLGAAAPIRRGAGAEKGEEYARVGLGVVDHALARRVGPSSTRPQLESREGM